jgi:hypothetical protein
LDFYRIGDWGLGIGDWGLGIGPNPQSPIPNPQSPIPRITNFIFIFIILIRIVLIIIILIIMSQSVSRYTKQYLNLMRTDIAGNFPKNVFLRNPINISNDTITNEVGM